MFIKGAAAVGVAFFGLCAIYSGIKVLDTRLGLVIDEQGIIDNSSVVAVGRIPWDDVIGFKVMEISGQRIITIVVTDPMKYAGSGNMLIRALNSANVRLTHSLLNISSNALALSFDETVQALTEAFSRYNSAQ